MTAPDNDALLNRQRRAARSVCRAFILGETRWLTASSVGIRAVRNYA